MTYAANLLGYAILALDGLLLAFFWTKVIRNWSAWNAACENWYGTTLFAHVWGQMRRPVWLHNFQKWTEPGQLGYPLVAAVAGVLAALAYCVNVGMHILRQAPFEQDLGTLIFWSVMLFALPNLALRMALRDHASSFGQELTKQREIFGVFKTAHQKNAEQEHFELSQSIDATPCLSSKKQNRL